MEMRLHEVVVDRPGLAGFRCCMSNIENATDFADGVVLNQTVHVPNGCADHLSAGMILPHSCDTDIAIHGSDIVDHRLEGGELRQDRLFQLIAKKTKSISFNTER